MPVLKGETVCTFYYLTTHTLGLREDTLLLTATVSPAASLSTSPSWYVYTPTVQLQKSAELYYR